MQVSSRYCIDCIKKTLSPGQELSADLDIFINQKTDISLFYYLFFSPLFQSVTLNAKCRSDAVRKVRDIIVHCKLNTQLIHNTTGSCQPSSICGSSLFLKWTQFSQRGDLILAYYFFSFIRRFRVFYLCLFQINEYNNFTDRLQPFGNNRFLIIFCYFV